MRSKHPNVVLIVTDDQGCGDIACHGNPVLAKPHLDRLHGEGVRLTDFHVDPICAPSRAAILTGRFDAAEDLVYDEQGEGRGAHDVYAQRSA